MRYGGTDYVAARTAALPNCTKSMILSRTWPRVGGLSEMRAFECKRCSIVFTEMVNGDSSIPERLSVLHYETYSALQ